MSLLAKRTQEMLMFGNQQNRQANAAASDSFTLNAEKRECITINKTLPQLEIVWLFWKNIFTFFFCLGTLASSGLGGLKAALVEDDKPSQPNSPSNSMYEQTYSPYEKNYE